MQDHVPVLMEVAAERERQIDEHGWTPEHDDRHDAVAWAWLLMRRCTDLACPIEEARQDDPRRALVEVAAIAVAAIESHDRRQRTNEAREGTMEDGTHTA